MEQLESWKFGIDNNELVELVLEGKKTATTSLKSTTIPKIGEKSIILFDNEKKACIVETKNVIVTKFKDVTPEMAYLEGEGDRTLEYYKKVHIEFFKTINPSFNDDTEVVFELFEVVEDLRKTRLSIAKKVVEANKEIFGQDEHMITEIDAGFNNDIFDIDNKYVIKICANNDVKKFENESKFYKQNSNFAHIPKFYKYDDSKEIINSVYEIIEKINGKTLYYYWYKMNETEREETIKEIIDIIKVIHKKTNESYDWTKYIKDKVIKYYQDVKKYYTNEEQITIEESFKEYDKYLSDNKFTFIHNDLHFDNIIKNEKGLFLIDFNDAMIAPIDFELRILYMCKDTPWKWANSEMDPYQKAEDYQNIDTYVKKYYTDFANIKYIDERMIIYRILNNIGLLSRFDDDKLKKSVLKYSKELLK